MKALKQHIGLSVLVALVFLATAIVVFTEVQRAYGNVTTTQTTPGGEFRVYTFFATSTNQVTFATTTSATSTNITTWFDSNGVLDNGSFNIAGARDVNLFFKRGDTNGQGNSGSTVFKIQVTNDGINWIDYNELGLIQVSGGADVFFARQGTTTISAATSTVMAAMEDTGFKAIRCIVVETTDGEHSCSATAQF